MPSSPSTTTADHTDPCPSTGTRVLMLIQDLNIRIINAATAELIRELTLDPTRDYQPRGVLTF